MIIVWTWPILIFASFLAKLSPATGVKNFLGDDNQDDDDNTDYDDEKQVYVNHKVYETEVNTIWLR